MAWTVSRSSQPVHFAEFSANERGWLPKIAVGDLVGDNVADSRFVQFLIVHDVVCESTHSTDDVEEHRNQIQSDNRLPPITEESGDDEDSPTEDQVPVTEFLVHDDPSDCAVLSTVSVDPSPVRLTKETPTPDLDKHSDAIECLDLELLPLECGSFAVKLEEDDVRRAVVQRDDDVLTPSQREAEWPAVAEAMLK